MEKTASESVGKPPVGSNWEYRVRNTETGQLCEAGEVGEVEILSSMRMQNYWTKRDEKPVSWIKMGDLGQVTNLTRQRI